MICLHTNWRAYVAYNFNYWIATEELLKVNKCSKSVTSQKLCNTEMLLLQITNTATLQYYDVLYSRVAFDICDS